MDTKITESWNSVDWNGPQRSFSSNRTAMGRDICTDLYSLWKYAIS